MWTVTIPADKAADGRELPNAFVRLWDAKVDFAKGTASAGLQAFVSKDACDSGKVEVPVRWTKQYVSVSFTDALPVGAPAPATIADAVALVVERVRAKAVAENPEMANATPLP